MDATNFVWQAFGPLSERDAQSALNGGANWLTGYALWLYDFQHRWFLYSHAQLDRHADYAYRDFCRRKGLDYRVGLDEWDEDYSCEWAEHLVECGYDAHRKTVAEIAPRLQALVSEYAPLAQIYDSFDAILNNIDPEPGEEHQGALWAAWFWQQTSVDEREQDRLRALPYRDYLKSAYWKRVRAAMLLISESRCDGTPCASVDSWYGGEFDLNVHHLHYKNRGRERLDNLMMLCSECHKRLHDGDGNAIIARTTGQEGAR